MAVALPDLWPPLFVPARLSLANAINSHYVTGIIGRPPVYLCICNAIRETDFRRAARDGSGDAEAIYRAMGRTPDCGSCLCEAEDILREEREGLKSAILAA